MTIDADKLQEFLGRFIADLGATVAAGNVVIGHRLGLYQALAAGPARAEELAARTQTSPRYVAEWLRGQAAGGYVQYDPAADTYSMTEEQAFALANPDGGVYARRVVLALGALRPSRASPTRPHRRGMGWHEHDNDVFGGCGAPAGYIANLVTSWIGLESDAARGARSPTRCGGTSTLLVRGTDRPSPAGTRDVDEIARKRAATRVTGRVSFEVAKASEFSGTGYDLAATFDCLHDMGDPLGAARHVRQALAPDGTWLIVEPYAGDAITDNLNPIGRIYYNGSTLLCVPNAMSQAGGYTLGAQAGEAAIRQLVTDAGFTRFRRAAETPFNLIFEARP